MLEIRAQDLDRVSQFQWNKFPFSDSSQLFLPCSVTLELAKVRSFASVTYFIFIAFLV